MEVSTKQKIAGGAAGGYLLAILLDPLVTVARQNVENWSADQGYDKLYQGLSSPPEWLVTVWEAITGSWGFGFVVGAAVFAFWDPAVRTFRREKDDLGDPVAAHDAGAAIPPEGAPGKVKPLREEEKAPCHEALRSIYALMTDQILPFIREVAVFGNAPQKYEKLKLGERAIELREKLDELQLAASREFVRHDPWLERLGVDYGQLNSDLTGLIGPLQSFREAANWQPEAQVDRARNIVSANGRLDQSARHLLTTVRQRLRGHFEG